MSYQLFVIARLSAYLVAKKEFN